MIVNCIHCGANCSLIESRLSSDSSYRRRRYECSNGHRFTIKVTRPHGRRGVDLGKVEDATQRVIAACERFAAELASDIDTFGEPGSAAGAAKAAHKETVEELVNLLTS
jgi:hypothetical protein